MNPEQRSKSLSDLNTSDSIDDLSDEILPEEEVDKDRIPDTEAVEDRAKRNIQAKNDKGKNGLKRFGISVAIGAGIGLGAVALAPLALGAIGFTAGGIAANSIAASMMSAAAIANGGGVAAGGIVATLQSVGAAGLALGTQTAVVGAGAAAGGIADRVRNVFRKDQTKNDLTAAPLQTTYASTRVKAIHRKHKSASF